MMNKALLIIIVNMLTFSKTMLFEGDGCKLQDSGQDGTCTNIDKCPFALNLLKNRQYPQNCGFRGRIPIVCCPKKIEQVIQKSSSPSMKAAERCKKYYPKPKFHIYVIGGKKAAPKKFVHMAIIGFGDKENIAWQCGGALISEQFVLTAAHCLFSAELGAAKWVRLGDLDIKNTTEDAQPQDFSVQQVFRHPEFKPPFHYNDIGLLKLDRPINYTKYVTPACLYTENSLKDEPFVATGWGKTDFLGETSDQLMEVTLSYVSHAMCQQSYTDARRLPQGIRDDVQICAGDPGKDTCQGDSGGPLQYPVTQNNVLHFNIVGVTSFGKSCGIGKSPGIYTRVYPYLEWIENIVWAEAEQQDSLDLS